MEGFVPTPVTIPQLRQDCVSGSPDSGGTPGPCSPEEVVGDWWTKFGTYSIDLNEQMELDFQENTLHGILRLEEDWYTAEIRDGAKADEVFGYLRLRRDGKVLKSYFRTNRTDTWENSKPIEASPFPYLRVGAKAAAEFLAECAERPWQQSTCCICFEALDGGHDFVELKCHHTYHRSCIRKWFRRSRSCPIRCIQP